MKKRPVFAIALVMTFLLALIAPKAGGYLYDVKWPTTVTIMLMYFGMGLNTDSALLKPALKQWKLLLATQSAIFILAPLWSLLLFTVMVSLGFAERSAGLLFIGAIPTTITSCIMLTKRYGGNDIGSLYNAVLAQFLGIVITPLFLSIVLVAQFQTVSSIGTVLKSLALKLVLPFIVGQLLRRFRTYIGKIGQIWSFYGIFFILYMNLAKVASQGNLASTFGSLAIPLAAVVVLCVLQILGTYLEGLVFRFSIEDRIALVFTGTQKTMGMGVPLATIYFASRADIAMDATLLIIAYYLVALMLTVAAVPLITKNKDRVER